MIFEWEVKMNLEYGEGKHINGPGINIILDGDEIARAIDIYLYSQNVLVRGARTIHLNDEVAAYVEGRIHVDPSGYVITPDGEKMEGKGLPETPMTFNNAFNEWRDEHTSELIDIETSGGAKVTQKIGISNMSEIYDSLYRENGTARGRRVADIINEIVVHANEWDKNG